MALAFALAANLLPINILPPPAPPAPPAPPGAPIHVHGFIDGFHVPFQEQDNWCWAAVAAGVAAKHGAMWQQCDIARQELGQCCCPPGLNSCVCNVPYYLECASSGCGGFARRRRIRSHCFQIPRRKSTPAGQSGYASVGRMAMAISSPSPATALWAAGTSTSRILGGRAPQSPTGHFNTRTSQPAFGLTPISPVSGQCDGSRIRT